MLVIYSIILIVLTELLAEHRGEELAVNFIFEKLKDKPTVQGVDKLIEYTLSKSQGTAHEYLQTIKKLTNKLI